MANKKTQVLALHGDSWFLDGPSLLQRDMGDPSWVDWYPDWKNSLEDIKDLDTVILIGAETLRLRVAS